MLCLVKIEIGLACASAGFILDCCLLEQHYRLFSKNFLFQETPFVLCTVLDCALLNDFAFNTAGFTRLKTVNFVVQLLWSPDARAGRVNRKHTFVWTLNDFEAGQPITHQTLDI